MVTRVNEEKEKQRRVSARVDETTFQVFEELKGLGVNTSELVREMLAEALPGLQGMVRVIRADREGRKLDVKKEMRRMLAELTKRAVETGMEAK